jgi:hypothetical protein
MEILLAIAVAVVIFALVYFNRSAKSLDINNDGKIDIADVKVAVDNTKQGIAADIVKVKTAAQATVKKVAAKKPVAKKPAAKKPAAKPAAKKR